MTIRGNRRLKSSALIFSFDADIHSTKKTRYLLECYRFLTTLRATTSSGRFNLENYWHSLEPLVAGCLQQLQTLDGIATASPAVSCLVITDIREMTFYKPIRKLYLKRHLSSKCLDVTMPRTIRKANDFVKCFSHLHKKIQIAFARCCPQTLSSFVIHIHFQQ